MNARMRRLISDYEQVKKEFAGHKYIVVRPEGPEPPEKYHVTYFVNGIYLLPDGRIQTLNRHEAEIILHADYPRYKPMCRLLTPIWHPNFRDGQICIGDIWGAGESLSDIIVNIGDMIQYKSWNSSSPLSAEAAQWAMENKHLFPVGNLNLNIPDFEAEKDRVEIELFDEDGNAEPVESYEERTESLDSEDMSATVEESAAPTQDEQKDINDFEITAEELAGIEFVPTAQRMQTVAHNNLLGGGINFKTIFMKGLLWALIGGVVGFILQELLGNVTSADKVMRWMGHKDYMSLLQLDMDSAVEVVKNSVRISSAFFSAFIAVGLGLFMGIGEGVFYGSANNAVKSAAIGAGISLALGFISGYIAQALYSMLLTDTSSAVASAFIRGVGWSIMGLGVGLSIGLIKPDPKRVLFCSIGGLGGGFVGGFLFNFIFGAIQLGENDTGTVSRGIGIIIMALLIGLGIGLLEQISKQAWLKVIRGEFEGKEYLVFSGTTSIGNNSNNTIVLFKDKLVGPHHCDIVREGGRYVLIDCGTPMGTVVNGMRIQRHVLRRGDAIAVGNSVLVFNTK